ACPARSGRATTSVVPCRPMTSSTSGIGPCPSTPPRCEDGGHERADSERASQRGTSEERSERGVSAPKRQPATAEPGAPSAEEINASIRYTMWSVFRVATPLGPAARAEMAGEVDALFDQLAAKDVVVRGTYDVSGLRADADLMIW